MLLLLSSQNEAARAQLRLRRMRKCRFACVIAVLMPIAIAKFIQRKVVDTKEFFEHADTSKVLGEASKRTRLGNYIRREHSVLSIFYLREVDGLRDPAASAFPGRH